MTDNLKKDNTFFIKFNAVFLVLFCIEFLIPYLTRNGSRIVQLLIMSLWALSAVIIVVNNRRITDIKLFVSVVIFELYEILYWLFGYSDTSFGNVWARSSFFLTVIIMLVVNEYYSISLKKKIIFVILGLILYTVIDNIVLKHNNGDYYETMSYFSSTAFKQTNIANTGFAFACALTLCIVFACMLNFKKSVTEILSMIVFIFLFYYVFFVGYTVTMILMTAVTLICLLWEKTVIANINNKKVFRLLSVIVFMLFIIAFSVPILKLIKNSTDNYRISSRIDSLIGLFGGDLNEIKGADLYYRFSCAKTSLKTWMSSAFTFFFGTGLHDKPGTYESIIKTGVGQHSQFIDTLAEYGLIGFSMMMAIMVNIFKYIVQKAGSHLMRAHVTIILCCYMLLNFVNNTFFASSGIVMFVLLILVISVFNNEQNQGVSINNEIQR